MDTATPIDRGRSPSPMDWAPLLLQTADALFPTGAYAHSLGFEECVRLGAVRDEKTLREFLMEHVAPALERFELPYVRFAHAAALVGDFVALAELDREYGAAKLARETREASAQLGGRRLKALRVILPDDARLAACERAVSAGEMAGHHAIICGVQAAAAGVPLEAALGAYFYQSLAGIAGASLKLIRIGQEGMQRALRAACAEARAAAEGSLGVAREEAGWFNPMLEIASMRHERAGERLFIS
jgi:urease accessory protein